MDDVSNLRIVAAKKGPPGVLVAREEARPVAGPGEALVRVAATGVAWADVMMREGIYPGTTFPLTPGYDVVGTIEALGTGVDSFGIGDRVAALTVRGGYARYVVVPAGHLVAVSAQLDPAETVSLVLNYVTAYQMLDLANLAAGDAILVHGAAGGVGTALLQLARLRSLRVVGTASKRKHDLVRELGATPIDYASEDVVARTKALCEGGVHAAFDPIGGAHWSASYAALRPSGTLVAYGASTVLSGGRMNVPRALAFLARTPRYSPAKLLSDTKAVAGYTITDWRDARPGRFAADLRALCALLANRAIVPIVAQRLPLEEAARAHELLGAARIEGKLVLIPS